MHIALDARMYHIRGGHGRYLRELIRELERVDTKNRYTIILHPEGFSTYLPANPNFRAIATATPWYSFGEQTSFVQLLRRVNANIVHFPHWNVPLLYRRPFVVTVHDLILRAYPTSAISTRNPFVFWIKYATFRVILGRALARAEHIITVSETAQDQITEYFPELTTQITAIHLGAGAPTAIANEAPGEAKQLPCFLYVGVAYPHKNLPFLLDAFHQFGIRFGRTHQLVLAGAKNLFYARLFETDTAKTLLANGDLVFIDAPSDAELEKLYTDAEAVVCPSLIEGFGLPALEAAARGVPVIASRIPAFQEVLDDAALYFDPRDIESLVATFASLREGTPGDDETISTGLLRSARNERLRTRAQQFSWRKTAEKTLEIYNALLH